MGRLSNQIKSISQLSERVGFSTVTELVDEYGGIERTVTTPTADIPAMVRYERTNESDTGGDQQKFVQEIKVWIRYNTNVTEFKELYWRSERYDIYAIERMDGDRFHVLKCRLIET